MASVIEELATTLPAADGRWLGLMSADHDPSVQALFLAKRVCYLLAHGRVSEARPFFVALDAAYLAAATDEDQLVLHEGFMESYIHCLEDFPLAPEFAFEQLGPTAKEVWHDAWSYCHGQAWQPPGA